MTTGQMLWWYKRGYTLDQLSLVTGLTRHQVHRKITRLRYERGEVIITERQLREHISSGKTRKEIADCYFCCESIISKKAKQFGLKMRQKDVRR
jgi:DNA-binding CsgD family transcriptional regulator